LKTNTKKPIKTKVAASFIVHDFCDMTPNGRKEVVEWIRKVIKDMVAHPELYGKTFTARYNYVVKK